MVQIDLHRADVGTRTAQSAREGKALMFLGIPRRCQDTSDRTWDGGLVAMPAAPSIHWAGIHACPTSDAVKRSMEFVAFPNRRPAIVDQD